MIMDASLRYPEARGRPHFEAATSAVIEAAGHPASHRIRQPELGTADQLLTKISSRATAGNLSTAWRIVFRMSERTALRPGIICRQVRPDDL
jgi:hypothetical protein